MVTTCDTEPPYRALAILRAVQAGRVEMTLSSEPDLKVDGLLCADQNTAHRLAHADLVRPVSSGAPGRWVRAVLSVAGLALLDQFVPLAG